VKVDGDLHVLAIAKAIGVFFTPWIFEFNPSLAALVMRWSQQLSTLARCLFSILATSTTGFNREWVAQ
jgi:hypothetical protein